MLTILASPATGSGLSSPPLLVTLRRSPDATLAPARSAILTTHLLGREQDARVAKIAFHLAVAGRARCNALQSASGLVLQHLSQFQLPDRPGVIAVLPLDRGPGVIVVVPGSPAATAGIHAGDVLLALDGIDLPVEQDRAAPFDARRAHARADTITDLLATQSTLTLTLWRDGVERTVRLPPLPACPSHVHLARSAQRNAFADGRHIFLTTGILTLLRNDDELAFIIAHEMAHNILGHASLLRGRAVRKGIFRAFGESGHIVRETESAADILGGKLMGDAQYDPVAGAAILERLNVSDLGIALFATHATPATRIAALRTLVEVRGAR